MGRFSKNQLKRFWPLGLIALLVLLVWWPGKPIYLHVATEREAARIAAITPAQGAAVTPERLSLERMMDDLRWLAHEDRAGRFPGTEGGLAARQFIVDRFSDLGLAPAGSDGYLHAFEHPGVEDAANVLGTIVGSKPELPQKSSLPPITIILVYVATEFFLWLR